jgi:3-phenylpropionate/trans-cinnamate dioxygenase ferredoxin subunit
MAFQVVCPVDELPAGSRKIVELGRVTVGVFNVEGTFYAVRNVCPHHGAPLCLGDIVGTMLPSDVGTYEYGLHNLLLQCPRHNWEFDLRTGESFPRTDRYRCRVYPVKVADGHVLVDA